MSHIYDNWERLVAAVLKKEELWRLFHEDSRTPSIRSEASSSVRSSFSDVPFGYSAPYIYRQQLKLVFVDDHSPDFEFEDVLKGSAEFLGKGTFGRSYTAAMDNGVKIMVRELKSVNMSEAEFRRSMEIVGRVKHENVVPLKAYVYSKDEKLMLYDYYSSGSVAALLHGRSGEKRANLDWETRLRIALGAARGIAYIHSQRVMKLFHGNIKSSNIFLNSQKYGCVSDFGLAGMIEMTFVQTARYHAPEVKSSQDVSQASDAYSFGILLLELLTGISPVPMSANKEAVDLATWVNSFKRKEWVPKVLDVDLIMKNPNIKDDLIKLLQIGIRCVAKAPKKRPKMSSVVKMIEDIRVKSTNNEVQSGVNPRTLVFLDGLNHGFDLEDMLGSSAEVLGKGTFGSTYKVRLEGGAVITVKRVRDVVATSQIFEKHMGIIGRLQNNNVAQLIAYYYSRDEKLLVYDYFDGGSLAAILHGENRSFLDWETRLKIAVGAARGIALIHKQDNQRLVHGNIKSANIFVNERKYGCVADVGLAALVSPISFPSVAAAALMSGTQYMMVAAGYRAPEVVHTKQATQASDVYTFGVVLLELISGKPPIDVTSDGEAVSLVDWIESVSIGYPNNEVYDAELLRNDNNDQVAMSQLLHLALDCVDRVPEQRPRMSEVVKMLEEISGIEPEDIAAPAVTRLEDLLPKLTTLSMETMDQL